LKVGSLKGGTFNLQPANLQPTKHLSRATQTNEEGSMQLAERLEAIPPYIFAAVDREIRAREARGVKITNLGIGSPDLSPPDFIVEAMIDSMRQPASHRYPSYIGQPALRRAMADYYASRFGVTLDPESQVLPLAGSKEGIAHVALVLVDPGDVVLVPDPGYPTYAMGTLLAGGSPHYMPLRAENGFLPDLDAIPVEVLERAVAMWVNYPNNPTGAIAPLEFYERVVALARRHNFVVLSDNAYADITYDGYQAPSFLQVEGAVEVGVEFYSLSKSYNMAGERVGMAVGNAKLIAALSNVKSNVDTGIFTPVQVGAITALTGPQAWLAERNAIYAARRDVAVAGLRAAGFAVEAPKAALYVWPRIPAGWTSGDLAMKLLDEARVWLTPGTAFGPSGEGFMRLSFCTDERVVREALGRVAEVLVG
jgi:LL-diaminopimelate aminotransferase